MTVATRRPPTNPFATRFVRPGAIPFLFPDGQSLELLIDRLEANAWWGEITGAHGNGKSTLLATLLPELSRFGREPSSIQLRDQQRRLPAAAWEKMKNGRPNEMVLVIDGYEQLGWWQRWRLKRLCRRWRFGLIVTTHHSAGLPTLHHVAVTPAMARLVAEHLLAGRPRVVEPAEVVAKLHHRNGDLREALFDLYDLHERRKGRVCDS